MSRYATGLFAALTALSSAALAQDDPDRVVSILALEFDMTRNVERTPFPDTLEHHPTLNDGGGLLLAPPDEEGNWRARAYQFHPATIVVQQGETVLLRFFGINGDKHPVTIADFKQDFSVTRGELTEVQFVADKAGIFQIICHSHQPSMTAQLVVLAAQ